MVTAYLYAKIDVESGKVIGCITDIVFLCGKEPTGDDRHVYALLLTEEGVNYNQARRKLLYKAQNRDSLRWTLQYIHAPSIYQVRVFPLCHAHVEAIQDVVNNILGKSLDTFDFAYGIEPLFLDEIDLNTLKSKLDGKATIEVGGRDYSWSVNYDCHKQWAL